MKDIAERLSTCSPPSYTDFEMCQEAATEILRLRKALETIQENYTKRGLIKRICSQALGSTDGGGHGT